MEEEFPYGPSRPLNEGAVRRLQLAGGAVLSFGLVFLALVRATLQEDEGGALLVLALSPLPFLIAYALCELLSDTAEYSIGRPGIRVRFRGALWSRPYVVPWAQVDRAEEPNGAEGAFGGPSRSNAEARAPRCYFVFPDPRFPSLPPDRIAVDRATFERGCAYAILGSSVVPVPETAPA